VNKIVFAVARLLLSVPLKRVDATVTGVNLGRCLSLRGARRVQTTLENGLAARVQSKILWGL